MVFSSIPAYLDPANWQQQPNHPTGSSTGTSSQLPPPTPPPPPHPPQPQQSLQPHGAGSSGSIRPGSMVDRARLASIPMPEAALKCPRCESTNTKFCYFNNYNLSQPRHFCKTCRRYWTRGGALRNVPVGGGCRRNKRSKASSSKSPVSSDRQTGRTASSGNSISSNSGSTAEILGLTSSQLAPLRFMNPLSHQLTDFAAGDMGLSYGLSYNPVSAPIGGISDLNFQIGNAFSGNGSSVGGITSSFLSASGLENWKLQQTQQYPLMAGLETSSGLYSFEGGPEGYAGVVSHVRPKPTSTAGLISQMASVKMEESHQEMNLSRQLLGMNNQGTDHQFWTGSTNATWTDLSANFSSSSNTASNPP